MANDNFQKYVIKDVTFYWPRLDQIYRYNNNTKKTEACAAGVSGAGWSIAWDMPKAEAKEFRASLKAHYDKTKDPKFGEFSTVFGAKPNEDGTVRFIAKRKAMTSAGKLQAPPKVVGPDLKELDDKSIWTGSKGSVRIVAFATQDPDGRGGISLLLDAVQVDEAVYGGDNLEDDFGPARVPAKFAIEEDTPPERPAAPASKTLVPANADWD